MEILSPAGNPEGLAAAIKGGCDAVYLAGKSFGARAFAGNFTDRELEGAIGYAHDRHVKVHVAVNTSILNREMDEAVSFVRFLRDIDADAVLIQDLGLLRAVSGIDIPKHASTQMAIHNAAGAKMAEDAGFARVVLARELSLAEIAEIHAFCPGLELEAFVHGAMCISYSGRCLLSNYLDGRDSNRGACVQACRWRYEVRPEGGKAPLPAEEDARGTYVFNSKDLNMLPYLNELAAAGVCSFKIEGRMKSRYYLATVVGAYRRALDGAPVQAMAEELETCAHRAFTHAYAFGENAHTVSYENSQTQGTCAYVADVLEDGDAPLVQMRGRFRVGDVLEVLSPSASFGRAFTVERMTAEDGTPVEDAKLVMQKLRLSCPYPLAAGDILRKRG